MVNWILKHPMQILVFWIAATIFGVIGLMQVQIAFDSKTFFDDSSIDLKTLNDFEEQYSQSTTAFVALTLPTEESLFSAETQKRIYLFVENAWHLPHVLRVDALSNYQEVSMDGDELRIQELWSPGKSQLNRRQLLNQIESDPTLVGRLVSRDLKTLGITISFHLPPDGTPNSRAIQLVAREMDAWRSSFVEDNPGYQVHIAGMVPLVNTFGIATLKDLKLLVPLSINISGVVLLLLLGSLKMALPILTVASLAGALAASAWAWLGIPYNVATTIAPVIILALTMAAALHVAIAIQGQRGKSATLLEDVAQALRQTLAPSCLAWLTTSIGFLAFNWADAPPFREMGNFVALGVTIGYLLIYTLMPCLYFFFGGTTTKRDLWVQPMAKTIANKQYALFIACIFFCIFCTLGLMRLHLDDNFSEYFGRAFDYRVAVEVIEKKISGSDIIELDLINPSGAEITEPAYLKATNELAKWLRTQPGVVNVAGVNDIVSQVHNVLTPDLNGDEAKQGHNAEYLFLYELSLPKGKELSNLVSVDRTASRMSVVTSKLSSSQIQNLAEKLRNKIRQQGYFDKYNITGLSMMYANLTTSNIKSMLVATTVSMIMMALIVALVLRRAWFGWVSLLVGLAPLIVGFGLWGWLQGRLGLPGAVIVALTIGIILDDAIHFIHKYRFSLIELGRNHHQSIIYAIETAGQAMILTTVSLISGFSLLLFSGFQINQHVGLFTCLIFASALLIDLLALPAILSQAIGKASPQSVRKVL